MVVCDMDKLKDGRGVQGAPDLVVEILSPSTNWYDRTCKFRKYEKAGVKEYWIVDPERKTVQVYRLEKGTDDWETGPDGKKISPYPPVGEEWRDEKIVPDEDSFPPTPFYAAGEAYTSRDKIPVGVLDGCVIDLSTVFPE